MEDVILEISKKWEDRLSKSNEIISIYFNRGMIKESAIDCTIANLSKEFLEDLTKINPFIKHHAGLAFDAGALYRSIYEEINEDGSFPTYPDDAPDKDEYLLETFK